MSKRLLLNILQILKEEKFEKYSLIPAFQFLTDFQGYWDGFIIDNKINIDGNYFEVKFDTYISAIYKYWLTFINETLHILLDKTIQNFSDFYEKLMILSVEDETDNELINISEILYFNFKTFQQKLMFIDTNISQDKVEETYLKYFSKIGITDKMLYDYYLRLNSFISYPKIIKEEYCIFDVDNKLISGYWNGVIYKNSIYINNQFKNIDNKHKDVLCFVGLTENDKRRILIDNFLSQLERLILLPTELFFVKNISYKINILNELVKNFCSYLKNSNYPEQSFLHQECVF